MCTDRTQIGEYYFAFDGHFLEITKDHDQPPIIRLSFGELWQVAAFLKKKEQESSDRRRSFRVPVFSESGLKVMLQKGIAVQETVAKDISMTGICCQLKTRTPSTFQVDDGVDVHLQYEGEVQTHRGIIRRFNGHEYGIEFPNSIKNDRVDPPDNLSRLVLELQRIWISNYAIYHPLS